MYKIKASPGRTVTINEKAYLYFSGTAYLGIPQDPDFRSLVVEGFERYGTNFGGSRLANVRFDIFDNTESTLLDLTGAPAAISASSGTAAGQLLAHYFFDKAFMMATPDAHPSMMAPGQVVRRLGHNWATEMAQLLGAIDQPVVLFCNAVNVLHIQKTDFSWLDQVPAGKNFTLVVDDSHYLGIGGVNGGGTFSELQCPEHIELVVVSSLGKAFGVPAGIILGSEALIEGLWRTPLFGGGSPTVLAYLHAFVKGQEIYKKNRAVLNENIARFSEKLPETRQLQTFEGYPVFSVKDEDLADELFQRGVLLSSFPYPSPTSPKVTRIVLTSLHQRDDIDFLLSCL